MSGFFLNANFFFSRLILPGNVFGVQNSASRLDQIVGLEKHPTTDAVEHQQGAQAEAGAQAVLIRGEVQTGDGAEICQNWEKNSEKFY